MEKSARMEVEAVKVKAVKVKAVRVVVR